jgi:hypothetical protein
MLLLLETIARGEATSRDASAEMIHLLSRQRVNDRIPRLLPAGTVVAHKTGNLPGVVNDVGIVYSGDQIFVVAVLVEGTRNDAEASRVTAELAAIAYEHFHAAASRGEVMLRTMGEQVPPPAPWPTPLPTPTSAPRPSVTETSVPTASTALVMGTATPETLPTATGTAGDVTLPTRGGVLPQTATPRVTATVDTVEGREPTASPASNAATPTASPSPPPAERRSVPGVLQPTLTP